MKCLKFIILSLVRMRSAVQSCSRAPRKIRVTASAVTLFSFTHMNLCTFPISTGAPREAQPAPPPQWHSRPAGRIPRHSRSLPRNRLVVARPQCVLHFFSSNAIGHVACQAAPSAHMQIRNARCKHASICLLDLLLF